MRFQGPLYRALNPVYARAPLSGEGAKRHGGRFNPVGVAALYTSCSIMTAIREANQIGSLQPTTLVAYEADIGPIFDATNPAALAPYAMTDEGLAADDWRERLRQDGKSPTQVFAETLQGAGFHGMQVRSFAKGAGAQDSNLVLWAWGPALPHRLLLVDDEKRLS